MKKTFAKFFCAALAAVVGTAGFASCGGRKNDSFYIGASGPLTGDAAAYGIAVKNGAEMAVREINAAGGLNGKKFKFEMKDDAHNATKVSGNYTALYESGMQVSLACVTSTPCIEFKNYAKEDNLFFLTPSATNDDVTKDSDNAYQMCFTDSKQGELAAEYIAANVSKDTKIGIFYKSDDTYSKGIYDNFIAALGTNHGYTIATASFTDNDQSYTTQIDNTLKDSTFIFMPIYYAEASKFMTQAKGKLANDAVYFGCDGFDGIDAISGFDISTIPQEISDLSHFNATSENEKVQHFVTEYAKQYEKRYLTQFAAAAYDCVYAIYDAMKSYEAGGTEIALDISPSALCDILKGVFQSDSFKFSGVTGTEITWHEDGTVNKAPDKYIVKEADSAA